MRTQRSVCQCFTARSLYILYPLSIASLGRVVCGLACLAAIFRLSRMSHPVFVSMSATLSGMAPSRIIVPSPVYISWTCLTVRPAFERYLKLRKNFCNSKFADSSKCFFFSVPSRHVSRGITTTHRKRRIFEPHGCFSTPHPCGAFRLDKARSGHGKLSKGG